LTQISTELFKQRKIYLKRSASAYLCAFNFQSFMKKKAGLFALVFCISAVAMAQDNAKTSDTKTDKAKKTIVKPSRDFVMLQLTYNNWAQTPDNVKIGGLGRGVNAYLCYDFPIAKSNFSFAAGLGVSAENVYFQDQRAVMNTSAGQITFLNVDTTEGQNYYKKSKLSTTYLEAPFELRFFSNKDNRNKGFKMAVGMRVGLLVGAHTKEKHSAPDMPEIIVEKVSTRRYLQTWRFAPMARIGWGNFSVYGSYNISQLFNSGQGPEVFPYSVGICITGL